MKLFSLLYRNIFKPIAFRLDAEFVHDTIVDIGILLGKNKHITSIIRRNCCVDDARLQQTIFGIHFANPIGLSAGFDKNAQLGEIISAVGFGFIEYGSITGEACVGNPKKRLWRLPKSKSLLVYYGLKNDGAEQISKKIRHQHCVIPVGINITKTNCQATVDMQSAISDYHKAFDIFKDIGDYTTINISCPNTFGGQPFTDPVSLDALLCDIDMIPTKKPTFIKLSPDMSHQEIDAVLDVIQHHRIDGIICSNLTKHHTGNAIVEQNIPSVGGLSGKAVQDMSNALISYVCQKTKGAYVIIGSGGIFTAEDAYLKMRLGASLVQLITGMVFEGPQVIKEINTGLIALLERDGYKHISEVVGIQLFEPHHYNMLK